VAGKGNIHYNFSYYFEMYIFDATLLQRFLSGYYYSLQAFKIKNQ